jgi:hypothetical protein
MEYSIMLLLLFSVISYSMLYVTEFSHLLAMLLLFIISVYLENNIFIIQLFLIIRVSGLLFKLCLKGSPRMYLLHVLKISFWAANLMPGEG